MMDNLAVGGFVGCGCAGAFAWSASATAGRIHSAEPESKLVES